MLVFVVLFCCVACLPMHRLHHAEGRGGVKLILLFDTWLKANERWSNSGSKAAKRGRNASIKYETLGASGDLSGEDFQNIAAFIVVRSSVFAISSGHKTHLARDAYHAYWEMAWGCQVDI